MHRTTKHFLPHNASEGNEHAIRKLQKLASSSKVVAIGECGLDFNRDFSPHPLQEEWFEAQFGITGWICNERGGLHLRELVKQIPAERLMLETDAPFLMPRTIWPKPKDSRNEPAYLTYVVEAVAKACSKPLEEIAGATTRTAKEFFKLE